MTDSSKASVPEKPMSKAVTQSDAALMARALILFAMAAWVVAFVIAFAQWREARDGTKFADDAMVTVIPWVVLAMGLTALMFMVALARLLASDSR
jgi:hypothetical protein